MSADIDPAGIDWLAKRSNGTAHVAAEMERPRPLKAAELSAQQRNALIDELVTVVNGNARAMAELRKTVEDVSNYGKNTQHVHAQQLHALHKAHQNHDTRLQEQSSRLDELIAGFVGQRGLIGRLRWMVTGR